MEPEITYQHNVRIYAEDVDYMGIVYHANYLRHLERARTEMLRQNNLILSDLLQSDTLFAISEINIRYITPARLDDLLTIKSQISKSGACSFIFDQIMFNQHEKLICKAQIKVVCVNSNLKPKRFPT
ncbi:MAG: YbgC/FadM family acyl-CoA thioesterase [Legionella sp.]|uniref:YbgC/FadM family acyl-CoA thioesterase n=1 Tax=Legionella sp. TaxID=459 RepID=UPI0039E35572